jgi:hypothetical protein
VVAFIVLGIVYVTILLYKRLCLARKKGNLHGHLPQVRMRWVRALSFFLLPAVCSYFAVFFFSAYCVLDRYVPGALHLPDAHESLCVQLRPNFST